MGVILGLFWILIAIWSVCGMLTMIIGFFCWLFRVSSPNYVPPDIYNIDAVMAHAKSQEPIKVVPLLQRPAPRVRGYIAHRGQRHLAEREATMRRLRELAQVKPIKELDRS